MQKLPALCLMAILALLLTGCVHRNSHRVTPDPAGYSPAHPIAAEATAQAEVSGELAATRKFALGAFGLSVIAIIALRVLVPGFAWVGGAFAAACLAVYVCALVFTFAVPWLPWVALAVFLIGGVCVLWHFRRWILAP